MSYFTIDVTDIFNDRFDSKFSDNKIKNVYLTLYISDRDPNSYNIIIFSLS